MTNGIISKVWSFASLLRADGFSYGGYLEQLTYQLFLKMADEYSIPPYNRETNIPTEFSWKRMLRTLKAAQVKILNTTF